jgi:hypothetical protein
MISRADDVIAVANQVAFEQNVVNRLIQASIDDACLGLPFREATESAIATVSALNCSALSARRQYFRLSQF